MHSVLVLGTLYKAISRAGLNVNWCDDSPWIVDKSAGVAVVFYNWHNRVCAAGVGSTLLTCFANIYTHLLHHNSSTQRSKNVFRQIVSRPQLRSSSEVDVTVNCYRCDDYDDDIMMMMVMNVGEDDRDRQLSGQKFLNFCSSQNIIGMGT